MTTRSDYLRTLRAYAWTRMRMGMRVARACPVSMSASNSNDRRGDAKQNEKRG